MTEPAITTERLTKAYGKQTLGVIDLDLEVEQGEVFGFLGPNGAGKTTTIRVLLDLIRPTYGSAEILGLDCQVDSLEVRSRVGYLPGEPALWEEMTGSRFLDHIGKVRGGVDPEVRDELVERLGAQLDRPISDLSTGNKRKLGLVAAFMPEPELLVLDEPTVGLDPLVQRTFHELIDEAQADGRTVFLSSHVLSEVERVCDRVGIIREGKLVHVGGIDEVKARAIRHVRVQLADPVDPGELEDLPGVRGVEVVGKHLTLEIQGSMEALVAELADHGVVDLVSREPDLEEVFMAYYGGQSHGR